MNSKKASQNVWRNMRGKDVANAVATRVGRARSRRDQKRMEECATYDGVEPCATALDAELPKHYV